MFAADGVKRQVFANIAVQHKLHAAVFQLLHALHDDIFFQLEARDAVGQQTAPTVITVIHRNLHPLTAQRVCCGQTTGASPNDANTFTALDSWFDRLNPTVLECCVRNVFLNRPDRNSAMTRLFDYAVTFTQTVLRADTAADLGERVCRLRNLIGFFQTTLGSHAQPVWDVIM